jgi:hypothetical protein
LYSGMRDIEIGNEKLSAAIALLKGALVTCLTQKRDLSGYRTIGPLLVAAGARTRFCRSVGGVAANNQGRSALSSHH